MKKLLYSLAALVALAVTAGSASAQYPGPSPYGPVVPATFSQPGCVGCDSGFGFGGHGFGGYGFGGHGLGGYGFGLKDKLSGHGWLGGKLLGIFSNHGGGGPQTLPVVDPRSGNAGQLAFPQNPFIRGPRDYFMWDER